MKTFTKTMFSLLKSKCNNVATIATGVSFLLALLPWMSYGQDPLKSHTESYSWNSEEVGIVSQSNETSHTVRIPEATWLRLYFDNVKLGEGSEVTITSLEDGAQQTLNSKTIAEWGNSSAYFNGNAVKVTITKPAAKIEAALGIYELEVGDPEPSVGTFSQCGSADNRVPSNDRAIGRIVPVGCTGWIIRNGKMVTAGHCTGSRMQILEFNVPTSRPDRSIVHPSPRDQYVITNVTRGRLDWAVFSTRRNSQTNRTALQAQGRSYNVVRPGSLRSIRITGYGVDTGSRNQTQQTHTGPFSSSNSSKLYYRADTEGGNSGSPVIDASTGNAVGVHTHGGCRTSGSGSNSGTNSRVSAFWNAMFGSSLRTSEAISNVGQFAEVYPNPASDEVTVSVADGTSITSVKVYNLQGSEVATNMNWSNGNQATVSVGQLAKGVYLMTVESENGKGTHKLVIE